MSSLRSTSNGAFQALLRIARASAAHPPWFAAPVDAEEDAGAFTVIFHAPERRRGGICAEATEHELRIYERKIGGGRRRFRVCALPCPILPAAIETARSGDLLRVRMPKKGPSAASLERTSSST